jgi:hypothetical protein
MVIGPVDLLAEGVSNGLNQFAIGLGDDLINMSTSINANTSYDGKLLVDIATFTYNPLKDPAVLNALKESALLYLLFLLAFIFVGGTYVQLSRIRPARQLLGMPVKRSTSLGEFIVAVFALIVIPPVVPFIMWLALLINYIISNIIMSKILPSILLTPDNVALYLGMAFVYAFLAGSFVWRTLVIGICMGYCLVIIVLIAMPYTRRIGTGLLTYYLIMVFMQPVILAVTVVGVGIIKFTAPFNPAYQLFCYLIFGLLLLVISLIFILGPITIMRLLGSAKKSLKLVI